jgi:hypothetical protein
MIDVVGGGTVEGGDAAGDGVVWAKAPHAATAQSASSGRTKEEIGAIVGFIAAARAAG